MSESATVNEAPAAVPKLLKVRDLMALLGVSRSWVYEASARGLLPCIRLSIRHGGGTSMIRFDRDEIESWLRGRRQWPHECTLRPMTRG